MSRQPFQSAEKKISGTEMNFGGEEAGYTDYPFYDAMAPA
jgi:hypothetical protein